jgi:hypothetical protein
VGLKKRTLNFSRVKRTCLDFPAGAKYVARWVCRSTRRIIREHGKRFLKSTIASKTQRSNWLLGLRIIMSKHIGSSLDDFLKDEGIYEETFARAKIYARERPAWKAAHCAKRRAKKLQAVPPWITKDDLFLIEEAHQLARLRTQVFGFSWDVDHIVPLQSKQVCGLHVWWNMQVIPSLVNIAKGNRQWPNKPEQLS